MCRSIETLRSLLPHMLVPVITAPKVCISTLPHQEQPAGSDVNPIYILSSIISCPKSIPYLFPFRSITQIWNPKWKTKWEKKSGAHSMISFSFPFSSYTFVDIRHSVELVSCEPEYPFHPTPNRTTIKRGQTAGYRMLGTVLRDTILQWQCKTHPRIVTNGNKRTRKNRAQNPK